MRQIFFQNQNETNYKYSQAMSDVAKHDSKQKRKSHYCEQTWIDFMIFWDLISVNYFLENLCKLIGLHQSRRFFIKNIVVQRGNFQPMKFFGLF